MKAWYNEGKDGRHKLCTKKTTWKKAIVEVQKNKYLSYLPNKVDPYQEITFNYFVSRFSLMKMWL